VQLAIMLAIGVTLGPIFVTVFTPILGAFMLGFPLTVAMPFVLIAVVICERGTRPQAQKRFHDHIQ